MAFSAILPYLAAGAQMAWRYRQPIMQGIDIWSRHRYRRERSRRRYQTGYLRGYLRGRRRDTSTGRYASQRYRHGNYARRQYYARRRRM